MEKTSPIPIINDKRNRQKRFDSIGTPDSPFRILLSNLIRKTKASWVKNEELGTHSCK
jgi:hypothetical protein